MIGIIFVMFLGAVSAQSCSDDDEFASAVAHGIHSIKLNDIQFFFDDNFTKLDNGIPTVNPNLTDGQHKILDNVPDFKSPFKQIGLQSMDFIMSKNNPEFAHSEANVLEKIFHELHMHEFWGEASVYYKEYVQNPPSCECLQEDRIRYFLIRTKRYSVCTNDGQKNEPERAQPAQSYLKEAPVPDTEKREERSIASHDEITEIEKEKNAEELKKLKAHPLAQLGSLEGPESWEVRKQIDVLCHRGRSSNDYKHMARYLYCKINNQQLD